MVLFGLFLNSADCIYAGKIDIQTAQTVANSFFTGHSRRTISETRSEIVDNLFYVFRYFPGFVLISSDHRIVPVLGYSFENDFDPTHGPPQLQSFIDGLRAYIQEMDKQPDKPTALVQEKWDQLSNQDSFVDSTPRTITSFYLLKTTWGQDFPYNKLCPQDPLGPGGHVYVGCLAVACGQIMKYWNYPTHGLGSLTYTHKYGTATADFRNTIYDWLRMPNSLTGADAENYFPIALLLYHCGVSIKMDYGPYVSLAYTGDAVEAFQTYFGYKNTIRLVEKDDKEAFPDESAWIAMLYHELDNKRPVIYSAARLTGYHAFNVDGYDSEGNFHVNFGWGGNSDGFYALNRFLSYSRDQSAIIGIQPEKIIADFNQSTRSGQIPLTVTFEDYSITYDRPPTSWLWDFGDGHTGTGRNPVHTYQKPGFYTVTLTVENGIDKSTVVRKHAVNATAVYSVVYVSKNGSDTEGDGSTEKPFATIQYGIDAAKETVMVMPGTYKERIDFKGKQISVVSKFDISNDQTDISNTIIDGKGSGTVVTFQSGETSAVLKGFTITNGRSSLDSFGGGITCINGSSPQLSHLVISSNSAKNGGGMFILKSSPILERVTITGNSAEKDGGGIYSHSSDLTLTSVSVTNNQASGNGGGIYGYQTKSTIRMSRLYGNQAGYGGGGYWDRCSLTMSDMDIQNNRSIEGGGGIFLTQGDGTLTSSTISGNRSRMGGGVYIADSPHKFIQTNITTNIADDSGGGVYVKKGTPTVKQSIISGNTAGFSGGGIYLADGVPIFDTENKSSIYFNEALIGKDFYTSSTTTLSIVLDIFSVKVSTPLYAFPQEVFKITANRGARRQVTSDVYVSPYGNDSNSGLSPTSPLKTIDVAIKILCPNNENPLTIHLSPGTYSPTTTGEKYPLTLISNISLAGSGDDVSILDAEKKSSVIRLNNYTKGSIKNLKIQNGNSKFGGGIYCDNSHPEIQQVIISGNQATYYGGGIYCIRSNPKVIQTNFIGNSAQHGAGLYVEFGEITLTNALLSDNVSNRGGGIFCSSYSTLRADNCMILDNSAYFSGGGIFSAQSTIYLTNGLLTGNISTYSGGGLFLYVTTAHLNSTAISDNITNGDGGGVWCDHATVNINSCNILNNLAYSGGGIFTSDASLSFDKDNRASIYGNEALAGKDLYSNDRNQQIPVHLKKFTVKYPTELYAFPLSNFTFDILESHLNQINTNIYVSPTGKNSNDGQTPDSPLRTIDDALRVIQADAKFPKTIFLAPGVYSLQTNGERFPISLFNHVSIKGSDNFSSILDGGKNQPILYVNGVSASRVEDIGLVNGRNDKGGAIFIEDSSPEFIRIRVTGNSSAIKGGGIYCVGNSRPKIISSIIQNNRSMMGGGIYCGKDAAPFLTDVIISENTSEKGGGLYCDADSNPSFQQVFITGNTAAAGGGMFLDDGMFTIEHLMISANMASVSGGGIYLSNSYLTLINSMFFRNTAEWTGSAVYSQSSVADVIHTTIADNSSNIHNSGIFCSSGTTLNIINSILWKNGDKEIIFDDAGASNTVSVSYSNIKGSQQAVETNQNGKILWKEGNMDADPLFLNSTQSDYHLQITSPCMDRGKILSAIQTDVDLDGRPQGGLADIGADEVVAGNRLMVMLPNGGEIWRQGEEVSIRWSSGSDVGGFVKIALFKGNKYLQMITESAKNSRIFPWKIPSTLLPGTDYSIRVISASNSNLYDDSDNYFFIESNITGATALRIDNLDAPFQKQFLASIVLQNPDGMLIENVSTTIEYDPNLLVFEHISLEKSVLEDLNYQLTVNQQGAGQIHVQCSSNSPNFKGEGVIFTARFQAIGDIGNTAVIALIHSMINSVAVISKSGLIRIIETTYDISGSVIHAMDQSPIANAVVSVHSLEDNRVVQQTRTNSIGSYKLSQLRPGQYRLISTKSDQLGGLTATDASRIARHAAKLTRLDCHQMMAADVTQDGFITSMDASRVARYAAGLATCLNDNCLHWSFTPQAVATCDHWSPISYERNRQYMPLNSDQMNQNFVAVKLGDVTGNIAKRSSIPSIQKENIIHWTVGKDAVCVIPIYLTNIATIEGLDIELSYDSSKLTQMSASITDTIFRDSFYSLLINTNQQNQLTMVIYANADFVLDSGIVAYILFKPLMTEGSSTQLTLNRFDCNESAVSGGFGIAEQIQSQVIITVNPVSLSDVVQELKLLAGIKPPFAYTWVDIVADGKLNLMDVIQLMRIVGKIN